MASEELVCRDRQEEKETDAILEGPEPKLTRRVGALVATCVTLFALGAFGVWLFSGHASADKNADASTDIFPERSALVRLPQNDGSKGSHFHDPVAPSTKDASQMASDDHGASGGSSSACDGLPCTATSWNGWQNAKRHLDHISQAMPWATSTTTTTMTTTTTTTTWCMEVIEGDACHKEVVVAMHAIHADPESFDGLNVWSSFEEVQDYLYHQSFGAIGNESGGSNATACWKSCPCQTARIGTECFDQVMWFANDGYAKDLDNFPNLTEFSPVEEFQMHLWNNTANISNQSVCSRPCMTSWRADTTLFCWSVSRRWEYEADIMKAQLSNGAGIFACDNFAVLSEENWTVGRGPGERIGEVNTVVFEGAEVGWSKDGTAGNAELFVHAWDALMTKTFSLQYDFVVKADPDAVIIADRLRDHLRPHAWQPAYIRNCNAWPGDPDYPMMFGALEAISKEGLRTYKDNMQRCLEAFGSWWRSWGEDLFMHKCLLLLGVGPKDDFGIIGDGLCHQNNDCTDSWAAAFHPYKWADGWMQCWWKATYQGVPKPGLLEV
jgi:hypothetical protein